MPPFAFVARDAEGLERTGTLAFSSEAALAEDLRRRGWLILRIDPVEARLAAKPARTWPSPSTRDVHTGLRQVALLLRSGLTLLSALRTTAEYARRASMGRRWSAVADRIEAGSSLVDALTLFPRQFPPLVRELVRAGEQSGTLDAALDRGADHLESARELRSSILQALFYPAVVMALTVGVASFMVLKVIPVLEEFLIGSRRKLPALTQALISVSDLLRAHLPTIAVVAGSVVLAIFLFDRSPRTRPVVDRATYRLPVIGFLRRLSNTVLFARTMSVLLASGVGIVRSLELAEGILRRPVTAEAIAAARSRILGGLTLSEGLAGSPGFSPLLAKMTAVGERGGELDSILADAATFHEADLRAWIKRASALVEPAVTVLVGAVVGFVYVAFFLALFSMAGGG